MISKTPLFFGIFYMILSLFLYFRKQIMLIELIVYLIIIIVLVFFAKKLPAISIIFLGLSVLPHFIGLFPISVNGNIYTLYDDSFIIKNYDLITHALGFFFMTLGVLFLLKPKFSLQEIILIFLALVGIGALVEISEFLGFLLFGLGKGWLMFGASDSSLKYGAWGDSMTDSLSNLIGIIFGFFIYFLSQVLRKRFNFF